MVDVLCVGILVVDVLVKPVNQGPKSGSLQFVDNLSLQPGGCALNTAVGLHKLGHSVLILGQIGNDPLGDYLWEAMHQFGLDTRCIQRVSTGTSGSIGLIASNGERTFLHYIGANAAPSERWLRLTELPPARHLHIGGAFLLPGLDGIAMAHVLAVAKRQGMTTSIDTAFDASGRWIELLEPSLPFIDSFLPSQQEAIALTQSADPEQQARRFLDSGVKTYGVKLGESGCYLASQSRHWSVPALPVPVRDTTGAGDAWVAGFLAAQLQGWPLPAAGLWGNALGAAVVQKLGAAAPIHRMEELYELLAHYGREAELQRYLSVKSVERTV